MSTTSPTIRFRSKERSQFFPVLRKRVEEYFESNQISRKANGLMYFKTAFFFGGAVLLYVLIISNMFSLLGMLGLTALLGAFGAFIGFNVSHDAIHGSYSDKAWVNKLVAHSFYFIGANPYMWKITHNQVHHTYTNIPDHDEDLDVAPGLVRLKPTEELKSFQKYQKWYAFPLYGLASLSWVMRKDYVKFFKKTIGAYDNSNHPTKEYFNLFGWKAVYYFLYIALPLIVLPITFWQWLLAFVVMHLVQGLVLGLVFQLAHVVEGTEYPEPNAEGTIEEAWAVHQMHTTANFGTDSFITSFLCGGLNQQIEHHLFPQVCHTHYPALAKIVRETAKEHGVPYIENKSFWTALQSHFRVLDKFGKEAPVEEEMKAVA